KKMLRPTPAATTEPTGDSVVFLDESPLPAAQAQAPTRKIARDVVRDEIAKQLGRLASGASYALPDDLEKRLHGLHGADVKFRAVFEGNKEVIRSTVAETLNLVRAVPAEQVLLIEARMPRGERYVVYRSPKADDEL